MCHDYTADKGKLELVESYKVFVTLIQMNFKANTSPSEFSAKPFI